MPPPPCLNPGVLLTANWLSALAGFVAEFWPILVPVILGMAAIYLLLPRARGYPPLWGGLLGGVALVFAGGSLIHGQPDLAQSILFYSFSGVAILGGVLLITLRNPVKAALAFALVVLATCGLFLLQAAPFLMAATVIIYAGAIIVTFFFVLMLAQQAGLSDADQRSREPFLATLAGFVLMGCILCVLQRNYDIGPPDALQRLDPYFAKIEQAARAGSDDEIGQTLEDQEAFFGKFLDEMDKISGTSALFNRAVSQVKLRDEIQDVQQQLLSPAPLSAKKRQLQGLLALRSPLEKQLTDLRYTHGSFQPSGQNLPLTGFSGLRPNLPAVDIPRDKEGQPAMPAENVASLGQSLFTDYLLPVELAGTLLLVAAIGAIAIAGRRGEGLR